MRFVIFSWLCFFTILSPVLAWSYQSKPLQDTTVVILKQKKAPLKDSLSLDPVNRIGKLNLTQFQAKQLTLLPMVSLQQYIKGNVSGVHIQEQTGEPGAEQNIFIHGTSVPILSSRDIAATQPLIVLDGVPLITKDHPFAYDIQQYDFNRIGPATNLLANIDPENIHSIEVIRNIAALALYGPRAANGVIFIKSKTSLTRRKIEFNSYFGLATPPAVTTRNGASELQFRRPFYDQYSTDLQRQTVPAYLRDSLYSIYYGPSNWTDLYYRNGIQYAANASVTGGSDRANFRASLGTQKNEGVADQTGLERYSLGFVINMKPLEWLDINTSINATQMVRDRNRSQRDRFAEQRYLPNLSNPISPNKHFYGNYLSEYEKAFDNNKTNLVNGYINFGLKFGKLSVSSRFSADYNEGYRDIFYPSTLLETNSYVSNYFGYNQRLTAENTISYDFQWNGIHKLDLVSGQLFQWDTHHYNYGYAYRGSSDYIKINLLSDPRNPLTAYFSNQPNTGFLNTLMYRFLDNMQNNLISFYGKGAYTFKNKYSLSLLLRADGSSNAQPTSRWFYSPMVSAGWDIREDLLQAKSRQISELKVHASYGRLGRVQLDDRFAAGPHYTVDIGYTGEPRLGTFSGVSTLNRPYSQGWVGYGIPWAYSEQFNIGGNIGLWNNRLNIAVDLYSKSDKNQLIGVPAFAEYGYSQAYQAGMNINNSGVDATIDANILAKNRKLQWNALININYNRNRLRELPNGLDELQVGNRLLRVGKAVDQFWLLENRGIYTSDTQVPVNPANNLPMSFQGIPLKRGDAIWNDLNGDYIINDQDRKLVGHSLPLISGGINNDFRFRNWTLAVQLYYNLGRNAINQDMAKRFDFVNQESANDMQSVKEITFWEQRGDLSRYPVYNPWSSAIPYRTDQDLFLENASFIKLRTISLGYDLTAFLKSKRMKLERLFVYATASNILTLTPYSGRDPELTDYAGFDTGYGLPIPKIFTFGIKMEL